MEDLLVDTAMEGLRNAVKYARAEVAVLHLAYRPDGVALVLQSGQGSLAPPADAPVGTGTGLAMLRLRAAQLRGALELTDDPGGGKVLSLDVPTRSGPIPP